MRLQGAISIERDKILTLGFDAFQHFVRGLLHVTKTNFPRMRSTLTQYLQSIGLSPNEESITAWLQENPGDTIGGFLFNDNGVPHFLLAAGTQAELRQIGEQYVEESNNSKGSTSVR